MDRSERGVDEAVDGLTKPVVIPTLEIAVDVALGSVLVYLVGSTMVTALDCTMLVVYASTKEKKYIPHHRRKDESASDIKT